MTILGRSSSTLYSAGTDMDIRNRHSTAALKYNDHRSEFCVHSQLTSHQRIVVDQDGSFLADTFAQFQREGDCLVIADQRVCELRPDILARLPANVPLLSFPFSERTKTVETVELVLDFACNTGLPRRGMFVAFGGGSCTDVVGLAASLYRRGAPHIKIPTTLMGMVDAGIATKNGVNFHGLKNRLGTFLPPELSIVTPDLLATLPSRHISNGLAECIKLGVIAHPELFSLLTGIAAKNGIEEFRAGTNRTLGIIKESILKMLESLTGNLYEEGSLQRSVDFGHTLSPLLESELGDAILHGEAVALDMAFHTILATNLHLLSAHDGARILKLIRDLGLPVCHRVIDRGFVYSAYQSATSHRGGALNLPMPQGIGNCKFLTDFSALDETAIQTTIDQLRSCQNDTSKLAFNVTAAPLANDA
ncbi:iron-containing alcohol dehydrogenase [Mesorhizobium sp. M0025]|uniref:3-dehydroquinate synthase family protein n=1 Tax=Mesorhizobium sp. M0025 TaxID=2956846 RepID=UPI00333508D9